MLRQRISPNSFWSSDPAEGDSWATGREWDAATATSAADVIRNVRMAAKQILRARVY